MASADRRFLSPDTLPAPFGYSHVVEAPASRVVYVSGQVPLDAEGQLVGAAVVAWGDVVKLTYFVTDMSRIASLRAIRDEYVDTQHPPASTLVGVSRLFREDVLVEIEAVAAKG